MLVTQQSQQPQYQNIFDQPHSTITDKKVHRKSNKELLLEFYRCKSNIFYFCHNYVFIEHVGTGLDFLFTEEYMHPKFRRVLRSAFHWNHNVMLMASRQLGKSSLICGVLLAWTLVFYPRIRVVILNMSKKAAYENLDKVRYTIDKLPNWMSPKDTSRSKKKSYIEYSNGSQISTFYYSTTSDPNTIGRSLTAPCLYIDEVAFIKHIEEAYGSAQQVLSTARKMAIKNNYPHYIVMTSTPNGVEGDGKFFYDMWQNAIDSDLIFEKNDDNNYETIVDNADEIVNDPSRNGFVKIQYHWSENSERDEKWYQQQCRELNFNKIRIAQELDLKFVAAKNCIFDMEQLDASKPVQPVSSSRFYMNARMDWFEDVRKLDKNDYYLIGVDTAWSLSSLSAFPAIEVFSYRDFYQLGELMVKLGSVTKFAKVVKDVFDFIYENISERIILCIENNSNGKTVIEHLTEVEQGDYDKYIYYDKKNEPGITTTGKTKELEVAAFLDYYNQNPKIIRSRRLLDQMSAIYRTYAGTIKSDSYTDLFMAACFCAYTRKKTYLKILPMLDIPQEEYVKNEEEVIKMNLKMNNPNDYLRYVTQEKLLQDIYSPDDYGVDYNNKNDNKRDDYGDILELYANIINI